MAASLGPDTIFTHSHDGTTSHPFVGAMDTMSQSGSTSSPMASPKGNVPPPNPPFVFPARLSSSSAPSSFSRATGRRPRSAIEVQSLSFESTVEPDKYKPKSPALPAFSFNPGASMSISAGQENSFLSPPQSPSAPTSPRAIPARPGGHGHKRGGSEFVGGNIRSGEAITVLSTSPTKSESGMASPLLQATKPAQRRGHAHRRSAAISSHDLSSIILPSPGQPLRGGSAPTSPALLDRPNGHEFPVPVVSPTQSEPVLHAASDVLNSATEGAVLPAVELDQQPRPVARNRVGFSDTLEYIPRPLSVVSTDTSSTVTARPGHSVSGSISSVISFTNLDRDTTTPICLTSSRVPSDSRPSTAGAVLERLPTNQQYEEPLASPKRRGSIPTLGPLPPPTPVSDTTPSPNKSGKKWSFFGLDPFVASSPTRSRPVSSSSSELRQEPASSKERSKKADHPSLEQFAGDLAELKPLTKKRSKKHKKVKAWSILSRKSKARHSKQKKRAPTPPPPRTPHDDGLESDYMHSEPEPTMPTLLVTESVTNGGEESWIHRVPSVPDEDLSYPMIDLDAALGPFNTPLPRNPEWEAAQRAGNLSKKQLHSAAGMSRFTGPGMHYHHRRAESAPEMVPFEGGRFGFPRFGSSSTMADVFEEDEEDEEDGSVESSTGQSTPVVEQGPPEWVAPSSPAHKEGGDSTMGELKPAVSKEINPDVPPQADQLSSDLTGPERRPCSARPKSSHSSNSREQSAINGNFSSETSRMHDDRQSLDISPTASPSTGMRPKELAPVDIAPLNLPSGSLPPVSPYSLTQSSPFPSPRSPMSYDAHRISTAPSSITEDNFQSLLLGEPGPEVRISVDDIPSLTSSNSTMTRESIFAHNPQARQPPFSEQPRPASFTGTPFGRRRSSLASLSRLISSSHGERSKLSMEVTLDSEPEKKGKVSKTKRLSRMVQFWKSKETDTS
ncbi:hypothetical protein QBC37DRAFT_38988 [Rhypophila decipiens]|uniref:Cell wall proline rich protein n=1 Tax=Rhypophila decipiens TaxID=261697 RepID=A0AAN6YJ70_9PEZI|nr:hypothetical protein QBC37DRAFT_38988 [Rhypophila decipiens]